MPPPYTPNRFPMLPTDPPAPVPPPNPPPALPWYQDATKLILVLVAIGTLCNTIASAVQGVISSMHGTKLDQIHVTQEANGQKIDSAATAAAEVKKELMYTTERQEKKLDATHDAVQAVGQKTDEVKAALPKMK